MLRLLCAFGGLVLFNFGSPVPRVAARTSKVLKRYKVSSGLVDHLGLADHSGYSVRRAMVARWMVPIAGQRQRWQRGLDRASKRKAHLVWASRKE